jgi:hypothetical protein
VPAILSWGAARASSAKLGHDAIENAKVARHLSDLATLDLILLGKTGVRLATVLHNVKVICGAPAVSGSALVEDFEQVSKRDEAE